MNSWTAGLLCLLAAAAGVLLGRFAEKRRGRRQIRRLTRILEPALRGEYGTDLSPFREGELSILTNQLELVLRRTEAMVGQLSRDEAAVRDFLADISHQLKTPLTGLLSYLELLEETESSPSRREQLAKCVYLAGRMDELTRALLELARLDAGAMKLHIGQVPAADLAEAAVRAAESARPQTTAAFTLDISPGLLLRCDEKWLRQALVNLLVNAMEVSDTVRLTAREGDGAVLIKVSDRGGGMDETELPHIFERFYRAKSAGKDGFGIGLSMAQSIVRLHKGQLRAVNEDGGLAMLLTLPVLPCADSV